MTLWHINNDHQAKRCHAQTPESCPFEKHYPSAEAAEKAIVGDKATASRCLSKKKKKAVVDTDDGLLTDRQLDDLDVDAIADTEVVDAGPIVLNRGEFAEFVSVIDSVTGQGDVVTANCGFKGEDVYGVQYAGARIYRKDGYLIIDRDGRMTKTPLADVEEARKEAVTEFSRQTRLDDDYANANSAHKRKEALRILKSMDKLGYRTEYGQYAYPGVSRLTSLIRGQDKNSIKENLDVDNVTKNDVDLLVRKSKRPVSVSLKSFMRSGVSPTLFGPSDTTEVALKFNPPSRERMAEQVENQKQRLRRTERQLSRLEDSYDDEDESRINMLENRRNVIKAELAEIDGPDPETNYRNYTDSMWRKAMKDTNEDISAGKSSRQRLIDFGFTPDYANSRLVGSADPSKQDSKAKADTFKANLDSIVGDGSGVETWARLNDAAVLPDGGTFNADDRNALHVATALCTDMIPTKPWTDSGWKPEYVGVTRAVKGASNDEGRKQVNGVKTRITGYRTRDSFEDDFLMKRAYLEETAYEATAKAKNSKNVKSRRDMTGQPGFEDGYYWTLNVSARMKSSSATMDARKGVASRI